MLKVIKNLLFVSKVLYLLTPTPEDGKEIGEDVVWETEDQGDLGSEDEKEVSGMEAKEKSSPASLLWIMKKLLVMATREAAHSPKDSLKVSLSSANNTFSSENVKVSVTFTVHKCKWLKKTRAAGDFHKWTCKWEQHFSSSGQEGIQHQLLSLA